MKKGFTLIEILAVIVLLAVITLITTPMIYSYIKQSKSEAFESGVKNVFDSVNAYMSSNENLKEISVTDDSLNLKNSVYTSGTIFINSEGSLEAENVSDGIFCASGVKNELNVSEANDTALPCSGLDITPPDLELRVNSRTASSITFLAVGEDRQSGILGYSYSLDQNTWSEISNNPIIKITGLSKSEEVTLYVKAYNINYDGTNEEETVTLGTIVSSTLAVDEINFEINTNESNTVKTLTIIYPSGEYTYSYSINDGEFVITTEVETDLVITENQKITARITYGSEITEKTISIEGIDSVGPVAHIEYSSTWQASKTIAVIIDEETSGLQTKTYSFDGGKTWQTSNTRVYANNETLTSKIKVRDKLGNITSTFKICVDGVCGIETDSIIIGYIDKESPTCTLKATNQTIGSGGWFTSVPITIGFDILTDVSKYCINGTNCETKYPGSGIKTSSIDITSITSATTGTLVTGTVVDNLGNIGTCTLNVKVDGTAPTITAKSVSNSITQGLNSLLTSYFNITFGVSSGTTTCYLNGSVVSNTNQLQLGINTVTCTATANNGKTASASTTFKHNYAGTAACANGRTLSGGSCIYSYTNNQAVCGCASWNRYCSSYNQVCTSYNQVCTSYNQVCTGYNTCQVAACGTNWSSGVCKTCQKNDGSGHYVTITSCSYCGTKYYYNYCANSACGCASYGNGSCASYGNGSCASYTNGSCASWANGSCASASSCTVTENGNLYYTCPTTGINTSNGTTISATASGSVCNF